MKKSSFLLTVLVIICISIFASVNVFGEETDWNHTPVDILIIMNHAMMEGQEILLSNPDHIYEARLFVKNTIEGISTIYYAISADGTEQQYKAVFKEPGESETVSSEVYEFAGASEETSENWIVENQADGKIFALSKTILIEAQHEIRIRLGFTDCRGNYYCIQNQYQIEPVSEIESEDTAQSESLPELEIVEENIPEEITEPEEPELETIEETISEEIIEPEELESETIEETISEETIEPEEPESETIEETISEEIIEPEEPESETIEETIPEENNETEIDASDPEDQSDTEEITTEEQSETVSQFESISDSNMASLESETDQSLKDKTENPAPISSDDDISEKTQAGFDEHAGSSESETELKTEQETEPVIEPIIEQVTESEITIEPDIVIEPITEQVTVLLSDDELVFEPETETIPLYFEDSVVQESVYENPMQQTNYWIPQYSSSSYNYETALAEDPVFGETEPDPGTPEAEISTDESDNINPEDHLIDHPDEEPANYSENTEGSEYDISALSSLNGQYVQKTGDLVLVEKNQDKLLEDAVCVKVSRNGEVFELEKGIDYTFNLVGSSQHVKTYKYVIDKKVFQEDGSYRVFLNSEDESGNLNNNEEKGAEIEFVVDTETPLILSMQQSATQTENGDRELCIKDDGNLSEVDIYLGDRKIDYNEDGDIYRFQIPEEDEQSEIKVVAKDSAGNTYERIIPQTVSSGSVIVRGTDKKGGLVLPVIIGVGVTGSLAFGLFMKKKNRQKR